MSSAVSVRCYFICTHMFICHTHTCLQRNLGSAYPVTCCDTVSVICWQLRVRLDGAVRHKALHFAANNYLQFFSSMARDLKPFIGVLYQIGVSKGLSSGSEHIKLCRSHCAVHSCTTTKQWSQATSRCQQICRDTDRQTDSNRFHLHKYMTLLNSLFKTLLFDDALELLHDIYYVQPRTTNCDLDRNCTLLPLNSSDDTRVNSNVQCGLMLEQTVMLLCK